MIGEKKSWGGKRAGAGRPKSENPKASKLYTLRLAGELSEIVDRQENKTEFIKECISKSVHTDESLRMLGDVYPVSRIKKFTIPFFDIGIVAGFPIPLDNDEKSQDIDLLRMLCPHPEASYLIRVHGNSMIDAGINSGDIVIVDKSNRNPTESQVVVCEFNGEYTLKRFRMKDGVGWLVPANPEFPEIKVTPEDDFSIWGTVTYILHKPKE